MLVGIALFAACEPDAWSPEAAHRREAAARAAALDAHLATLPGVARASVILEDTRASVVLALAPGADADAATASARTATASAEGIDPAAVSVVAAAPAPRDELVDVGPFRVAAGSRAGLIATLAIALVIIAGLGAWLAAMGSRRRSI